MLVWNGSAHSALKTFASEGSPFRPIPSRLSVRRLAQAAGETPFRRLLLGLLILAVVVPAAAESPGPAVEPDGGPADPRIPLVEQRVGRDAPWGAGGEKHSQQALAAVEKVLAEDPAAARSGLDYLRGHLLLQLGRRQEALEAFAATMGAAPELGAYSRYRLAVEQEALGHPEVAAGLTATLLGSDPPSALVVSAVRLLERTLAAGGDCRLLRGLVQLRWRGEARRRLALASAGCAARGGDPKAAADQYFELLERERRDDVARTSAERLIAAGPGEWSARHQLLVGLAFYNHREFERAIPHLARALVQLPAATDVTSREEFDCRYALARSHFWLGRHESAAAAFDTLAKATRNPEQRAQALHQKARCLELAGDWQAASATFASAYQARPQSRGWADAALISHLRLEWLGGDQTAALEAYRKLVAHRRVGTAARALLFLASSELVQGRVDRAEGWLASAERLGNVAKPELLFWRGRLEEGRGRLEEAVTFYARALGEDAYHPFGRAARARLEDEAAAPTARRVGRRLAASERPDELYRAWLLLGAADPQGQRARRELESYLAADRAAAPFLRLAREPAGRWPLWRAELERPEEMLLALGLFDQGASAVLRHFPVAEPPLAFTGSLVLARSGETKQSLYIAEILAERIPRQLYPAFLSTSYRRLLFPLSYGGLIRREAGERGVDPFLLAAVIREESRFDPRAFSAASARGLTQFVFPTARRVAEKVGLGPITPADLENPETAIILGAAYLEELLTRFGGATPQAVAAYNAGEPQADLWRRYCLSDEPEEYLTKVAFRQTRAYLAKVLTSREHYAELYGSAVEPSAE